MMITIYNQRECWKCGVALVVPDYDDSTYTYCQPCAFSKLGVGLSYSEVSDE